MKLLLTGAAGKLGQNLLLSLLSSERFAEAEIVALCNNRMIDGGARVQVVKGSLSDRDVVSSVLEGVTHVVHMAAVKESPDLVIDVAIKGMFLMLEEFRQSPTARQFILIGGDCSVGHMFHEYGVPITETSPRKAYAGCYALTKVIEEVMLEQYYLQYGLAGCTLRAPWIMEKDDFRYAMSFGKDQFGGPMWQELIAEAEIENFLNTNAAPLLRDRDGAPLKRNFVHVDDLVSAILAALDNPKADGELFNISMDKPVDYGQLAEYLGKTRDMPPAEIKTSFHSNWLDNSKARMLLGWQPKVDFEALVERAWNYKRDRNDPRKVWYPG